MDVCVKALRTCSMLYIQPRSVRKLRRFEKSRAVHKSTYNNTIMLQLLLYTCGYIVQRFRCTRRTQWSRIGRSAVLFARFYFFFFFARRHTNGPFRFRASAVYGTQITYSNDYCCYARYIMTFCDVSGERRAVVHQLFVYYTFDRTHPMFAHGNGAEKKCGTF